MKARRKIMRAGLLWFGVQYQAVHSREPTVQREAKSQISSTAREKLNANASFQKLMLLIACNFLPSDSVVTLTYRPEALPRTKEEADKRLTAFIRAYRATLRANGTAALPYIRVTEGFHSEGRFHHHVIMPRTSAVRKDLAEHWQRWGDVLDVRPMSWGSPDTYETGAPMRRPKALPDNPYFSWAKYLSKECREKGRRHVGERMWRASLGLNRPTILYNNVDESDALTPPPGAFVSDYEVKINEYGRYTYITAIVPEVSN